MVDSVHCIYSLLFIHLICRYFSYFGIAKNRCINLCSLVVNSIQLQTHSLLDGTWWTECNFSCQCCTTVWIQTTSLTTTTANKNEKPKKRKKKKKNCVPTPIFEFVDSHFVCVLVFVLVATSTLTERFDETYYDWHNKYALCTDCSIGKSSRLQRRTIARNDAL